MIGDGCCAFVSISLGEKKPENAAESVGNSILLCILSGLLLTAVYLLFSDPILTAFGGRVNEETFAFSKEYFFWITLGIPFISSIKRCRKAAAQLRRRRSCPVSAAG